jgi:hypothetical protein
LVVLPRQHKSKASKFSASSFDFLSHNFLPAANLFYRKSTMVTFSVIRQVWN